jgi:hypothetical protein
MFIILKHSLAWMVFGASRPSFKFPRYVIQVSVELSKLKLPTIESERPRPASAVQCPSGGDLVGSSMDWLTIGVLLLLIRAPQCKKHGGTVASSKTNRALLRFFRQVLGNN